MNKDPSVILHDLQTYIENHLKELSREVLSVSSGNLIIPDGCLDRAVGMAKPLFHHNAYRGALSLVRNMVSTLAMRFVSTDIHIYATFETVDDEHKIVGTTSAKVKRIEKHDDGSVEVIIDHWPENPLHRKISEKEQLNRDISLIVSYMNDPNAVLQSLLETQDKLRNNNG